ncbi:MAG: hypothetical protein ACRYGP_18785 [Janthinobacterium lividum]
MAFEALGLLAALLLGQPGVLDPLLSADIAFRPRERAVSDWRWQAALNLDASPGVRANILVGRDPAVVTRCVRLNNYWCIKRAGWVGEIASDADGHVAFRSAADGATVAALLLRRYYVVDGRHSALAIVSHWAPASCGASPVSHRGVPRTVQSGLASRGLGRTLRARWLAAHGHRVGALGRGRARVSRVPDRLIGAALPAPTIALGLGSAPVSLSAALPDVLAGSAAPATVTGPACSGDTARIANYAAKAAAGISPSTTADLGLFDAAGVPTPNLAHLMRNMSAVEIGPLGASTGLVETAVAQAAAVVAARRAAIPSPGAVPASRIDEARRPEPAP